MLKKLFLLLFISLTALGQQEEKHLKNIRQLTFGGNNAEAYFSRNDKQVSYQSDNTQWGLQCDQIFVMDLKKGLKDPKKRPQYISTGLGRTTCAFFMPDGKHVKAKSKKSLLTSRGMMLKPQFRQTVKK